MKLKERETGLALGAMVALMHVVWAVMVWLGVAQLFLDWALAIHFLSNLYTVLPFDLAKALTLVIATFIVGYAVGWVFANIWNRVAKK